MKANEFRKMLQLIVREELQRELPRAVEAVLTEKYIKKIVAESGPARMPSLAEVVGDDLRPEEELENEPPEVMQNSHNGIYQKHPLLKKQQTESRRVSSLLLSRDNPLASIYEDIRPEESVTPDLPLEKMARAGMDFGKMNQLKEAMEPRVSQAQADEHKMKMLEMQRKRLEVPVNGGSTPQQPARRRVQLDESFAAPSHLDIPPFEPIPGA